MLKKLLKYDMRPMIKLWRVLAIIIPILAITGALDVRFMNSINESTNPALAVLFSMFSVVYIELVIFAIFAVGIVNMVFLARRTASDFFSDRGQLTFTLPVDRDDLYMSKFLNSLIWNSVASAALVLTLIVFALLAPEAENGYISTDVFDWIADTVKNSFKSDGIMFVFKLICYITIFVELNFFSVVLINYSVIKCRSAGGIGMSIGIVAAVTFGTIMLVALSASGFVYSTEMLSKGACDAIAILMLLGVAVLIGVFDFLMFFDGRDRLKYDLNIN